MTPELWKKVTAALDLLLPLPVDQRLAELRRLRAGDAVLADKVQDLLAQHETTWALGEDADEGETAVRQPQEPLPGQIGPYTVLEQVGRGGMGAVYRVRDRLFHRSLAVKVLAERHACDEALRQRFLEEAHLVAQLQHPGIPPVHDVGELPDGRPYFAMKLVKGQTLTQLLKERSSPQQDQPRFLGIFEQTCRTLAFAHAQGIIHRDLKPANVMVGPFGEVQVMDWGLAKVLGTDRVETAAPATPNSAVALLRDSIVGGDTPAGLAMGTPAYMAPEQARGAVAELDARTDVFGLGAILLEVLTGAPPYDGAGTFAVLQQACLCHTGPAFCRLEQSGTDALLVQLVRSCLAEKREDRLPEAGAVAAALASYDVAVQERLRQAEVEKARAEVQAAAEHKRRHMEQQKRRRERALVLAVGLLMALAGATAWVFQQQRDAAGAHRERADGRAAEVLLRARALLDEGWNKHDLAKLSEAHVEALRAVDIVQTGDGSVATQDLALRFQTEVDEKLRRAQKNTKLLAALLDIALPRETPLYVKDDNGQLMALAEPSAEQQYAAAFRSWGLDVDGVPAQELAARLRAEPDVVAQEVVAALDKWMLERKQALRPDAEWRRLLQAANQLDPEPGRQKLRLLLAGDSPPRAETVAGLVGARPAWTALAELGPGKDLRGLLDQRHQIHAKRQPTLTVLLQAQALAPWDAAAAERGLRQALALRPSEVVLLNALGKLLQRRGPARWGEAIECYRAVRALRPHLGVVLANALVQAGRAEEAEQILTALVQQQSNNPELRFYLGDALAYQQKHSQAVLAYSLALEVKPDFVAALNNRGRVWCLQKAYAQARADFDAAIALDSQEARFFLNRGVTWQAEGDYGRAVADFNEAIRLNPQFASAFCGRGLARYAEQQYAGAIADFTQALALNPKLAAAYHSRGLAWYDQQQYARAIADFTAALGLDAKNPLAFYHRARAWYAQKQYTKAIADYGQAIRLNPRYPAAFVNRGLAWYDQKDDARAIADYSEAIRLDPRDAKAYYNRGNAWQAEKDFARASADYGEAIRLDPKNVKALNNRGSAWRALKEYARAIADFTEALRLDPKNTFALNNRGSTWHDQTEYAKAIADYTEAIGLDPQSAYAFTNRGNTWLAQKDYAKAIADFTEAIRLQPARANAFFGRGLAWQSQKEFAKAIADHTEACRLDAGSTLFLNHLSIALLQHGDFAESANTLGRICQLLPAKDPLHALAKKEMLRCQDLLVLEKKLLGFFKGDKLPAADLLALADLCHKYKDRHSEATQLYAAAFLAQPQLAGDLARAHRVRAIKAAVLAAAGKSAEAPDKVRVLCRQEALVWLKAEYEDRFRLWQKQDAEAIYDTAQLLSQWQQDADFAGVREIQQLAALPKDEQQSWLKFWAAVSDLLERSRACFRETMHQGKLTQENKEQVYPTRMTAGKKYIIDMESDVFDTYLRLENGKGKILAFNDDIDNEGGNLNSRIIFTPDKEAHYDVIATSFEHQGIGPYTLTIREFVGSKK